MRRLALTLLLLLPVAARAGEGVYITLDGGYALWGKDDFRKRLQGQVGTDPVSGLSNVDLLVDRQLKDGPLFGLHLGYNIGGHVAFEAQAMISPYDVLADTRGSATLFGGSVHWFPLQGLLRPNRQFDVSLIGGMDYVLTGGSGVHGPGVGGIGDANTKLKDTGRGFDGVAVEVGATLELYPAKWVSLGLTPRMFVMDPMRYFVNFDNRDQGGAIPIGGKGSLMLYSLSLSVAFHFEPLPD